MCSRRLRLPILESKITCAFYIGTSAEKFQSRKRQICASRKPWPLLLLSGPCFRQIQLVNILGRRQNKQLFLSRNEPHSENIVIEHDARSIIQPIGRKAPRGFHPSAAHSSLTRQLPSREPAVAFALAFLFVIPAGNLLSAVTTTRYLSLVTMRDNRSRHRASRLNAAIISTFNPIPKPYELRGNCVNA